jgi:16S rRNA (cytidine1402-2'-O)-methyltransferase
LIARLRARQSVALVSDAGTPLVSDPGYKLAREALDAGLAVVSIPGPSASLAALTSSGLPTDTFLFAGFLPPKSGPRRARLEELRAVPATLIFFETGPRLAKSLADMADVLGPHEGAIAKELTKLHERVTRGELSELVDALSGEALKGEIVIVVGPPEVAASEASDAAIVEQLEKALNVEVRDACARWPKASGRAGLSWLNQAQMRKRANGSGPISRGGDAGCASPPLKGHFIVARRWRPCW